MNCNTAQLRHRSPTLLLALLGLTVLPATSTATEAVPLLAVDARARSGVQAIAVNNTDEDDGTPVAVATAVTFGRALNLQGTPLILRSRNRLGALIVSGQYNGPFVRPAGQPVRASNVSSGFGTRWHPVLGGYRFHAGIDLVAPVGTLILATAPGIVTRAGWCGGYGLCVTVDDGNGYQTLYGHLSRADVIAGQDVTSGQRLGLVGSTGRSTGPHLHYEVRINGHPVDPRPYMNQQ